MTFARISFRPGSLKARVPRNAPNRPWPEPPLSRYPYGTRERERRLCRALATEACRTAEALMPNRGIESCGRPGRRTGAEGRRPDLRRRQTDVRLRRRTLALQKRPLLHALARLFREEYQEFLRVGVNEFRVSSEGNAHRP